MSEMKHRSFWKTSGGVAGLIILLAVIVAANVVVGGLRMRADLTKDKLYTLSAGTKSFLKKLDAPVTLKLFFSGSAPEVPIFLKTYAKQVQDLLQEYKLAGGGNVVVEAYDPKPDSDAEEWAQRYGITGQGAGPGGTPIYFGLVASAGKTEGSIAFLDPRADAVLEFNITRLISRTVKPEKPRVGIISDLPVLGEAQPNPFAQGRSRPTPWLAFKDMQEDYELVSLPADVESIDKELQTLILVHPKELPEKAVYAIDQFVLRGGRLLAFVDPFCVTELESMPQQQFMRPEASSNIEKLFSAWGVGYDSGRVVADPRGMTRLQTQAGQVDESLVFLSLTDANCAKDDILTAQLESVMLPFCGSFSDLSKGLTFKPLVTASPFAGVVDTMLAQTGGAALRRSLKPSATPPVIAARLSGTFKTAFPEGRPKPGASDEPAKDAKNVDEGHFTEGESTVILVADVDLLVDRFCVEDLNFFGTQAFRPLNNNLTLFGNAVEQLSGSSDLIGIRSRGNFQRPFERVTELEEKARSEWQAREQDLEAKLQEAREQLGQLETQKDPSRKFILSAEQKSAIERFHSEEIRINKELKEVRKSLRRDIERLGVKVKVVNIVLMPALVCLAGIGFGLYRRRKK
jgi:ABC-type uncharacterized transport system involved in gliding motility auxiliary subunit